MGSLLLLGWAGSAAAHGFGQHYDLPAPLWLYVVGAAATVAVSFVVVGLCAHGTSGAGPTLVSTSCSGQLGRFMAHPVFLVCLKLVSAGLLVLIIVAGLLGHQNPAKEPCANAGVGHLVGWAGVCLGPGRQSLGASEPLEGAFWVGRGALSSGGSRAGDSPVTGRIRLRWGPGRGYCCS